MVTVILVYLLIGWIMGFIFTIIICLNAKELDNTSSIISITQIILYWPWFLGEVIFFLITDKRK